MVQRRGPVSTPLVGCGPVRTCVGCRSRALAGELLRVAVVDGNLVPDPRRRIEGRGAWLHPDLECLGRAERRRAFPRALRVQGPLDAGKVRAHLEQGTHHNTGTGASRAGQDEGKQVDPS